MVNDWFATVRDITVDLVQAPSVNGTPGEKAFAAHIHALLAAHPYFAAHPDQVWIAPVTSDPWGRSNVYALVRGSGAATVVLAGHYDVVSVENYGLLAPLAFEPDELLPRLIEALEAEATDPSDQLALRDLQSGDFLPGRGVLDMKSGLAAGIAVLYHFAESAPERTGNLLFVATPDEEVTSFGMRDVALRLPELVRRLDLAPVAAINLDAVSDRGTGVDGQSIFLGSVGKLLSAVYVVGRDMHVSAPFDGVSAALLAAAITRRIECNVDLADGAEGDVAPPPVTLKQVDLKDHYDVTAPAAAWSYYNVLTHGRDPQTVLEQMRGVVAAAIDETLDYLRDQARRYNGLIGSDAPPPAWSPVVLTFAELKEHAIRTGGPAVDYLLRSMTEHLAADPALDLPEVTRRIITALWPFCRLTGPASVICFGALYYPCVLVDKVAPRHARLRAVVTRVAAEVAAAAGTSVRVRPFLPGISDMSFLSPRDTPATLAVVAANTPATGSRIEHDYLAIQAIDLPMINVGPWGRDYHQRTERVHMPYSFGVVPELIWRIAGAMLDVEP